MVSGHLLSRLLLLATPAIGSCAPAASTSGRSGYPGDGDPAAPRSDGASAVVPGRSFKVPPVVPLVALDPPTPPGHRAIRPPLPPLKPLGTVPVVESTGEQPGEQPYPVCSLEYYSNLNNASGGPFPSSHCYEPAVLPHDCVEATAPHLPRLLDHRRESRCVYDGPYAQKSPTTNDPWCCYNLGWKGIGRPLLVAGGLRRASLARGASWA